MYTNKFINILNQFKDNKNLNLHSYNKIIGIYEGFIIYLTNNLDDDNNVDQRIGQSVDAISNSFFKFLKEYAPEIADLDRRMIERNNNNNIENQFGNESNKPNLIIITDAGRDPDDEEALLIALYLMHLGKCNILGIVVNLSPEQSRSLMVRGILDLYAEKWEDEKIKNIPVAVGTNGLTKAKEINQEENDKLKNKKFSSKEEIKLEGKDLLRRIYCKKQPQKSITLLLISSMKDAWCFIEKKNWFKTNKKLFKTKTKEVVIMGGAINNNGIYKADNKANNNTFDWDSAVELYKFLYKEKIKTKIIDKTATNATKIDLAYYGILAKYSNDFVDDFLERRKSSLGELLSRIIKYKTNKNKEDIEKVMNPELYMKLFTDKTSNSWTSNNCEEKFKNLENKGDIEKYWNDEELWKCIKGIQFYDSLALFCCFPNFVKNFVKIPNTNDNFIVIGKDQVTENADKIRIIFKGLFKEALSYPNDVNNDCVKLI